MTDFVLTADKICSNGYPDCGCAILNNLTLNLQREEWWRITGESGSGKTLFMRCMAGLVPHRGSLSLNGKSFQSYSLPEWRRKVLFVGSKPIPFSETIGESILLPFRWRKTPVPSNEIVMQILRSTGLKFDLDASTKSLSDGERVRLALVASILLHPEVLLLDETLASLDNENAQNAIGMIRKSSHDTGMTVVWVDHGNRLTGVEPLHTMAITKP